MAFEGFSSATLEFLEQPDKNNDKLWFDAHRSEYEQHYIEPAKQFVSAMGERVKSCPGYYSRSQSQQEYIPHQPRRSVFQG